jgi:uncharacterized protein (DUF3084 family)
MLVSPIIFIWRVVARIRDIRLLKSYKNWQERLYEANQEYFQVARSMSTRLEDMETFKRRLEAQYSVLFKQNEELYNQKIADECAKHEVALEAERTKTAKAEQQLADRGREITELTNSLDNANGKLAKMERGYKASSRRTVQA